MIKIVFAIVFYIVSGFSFFSGAIGYLVGMLAEFLYRSFAVRHESPEASYEYYSKTNPETDFTSMLVVLSAAVMRADGKLMKTELDFVKTFLRQNLGNRFKVSHLQQLKHFLNTPDIPLERICLSIKSVLKMESRILLLHFLFGIAAADGEISQSEIIVIQKISGLLGISAADFQSVHAMFVKDADADYKILEIEKTAGDDEVKKAYRQLAIRFHPDKVAHLGEEYQKRAKEKFQQLQQAYENIRKERGMV